MSKVVLKSLLVKKGILMTFLVLCSLFVSEKAFSQRHWSRDLMNVSYVPEEKAVQMSFEFKEFVTGSALLESYLELSDFEYSTDNVNFKHLMSGSIFDTRDTVGMNMHNKLTAASLQFFGCYSPPCTSYWVDSTNVRALVDYDPNNQYWLTIRWHLKSPDLLKDVMYIRITGKWNVNGSTPDVISEVYKVNTKVSLSSLSKVETDSIPNNENIPLVQPVNNPVKMYSEADAVVIKGAVMGENIKVYTTSGMQIKSVVTDTDAVKITLPKNQIYFVNIGQAQYKVAL